MRQVVSDTGPILHLQEAGALELLHLAGRVHIPPAVEAEVVRGDPSWKPPEWLVVDTLAETAMSDAIAWQQAGFLDVGEAEALALARQLEADWLLTDDAAARLLAQALGVEVHGSLGVVLWAAAVGHLNPSGAKEVLERLARSSLWISQRVLAEAMDALDRLSKE